MKLWLIRHAKSSWSSPTLSDFERPLNKRGERDGPRMAAWLGEQPDKADWLWTSSAVRARATAGFVAEGCGIAPERVTALDSLYGAGPREMLDVLKSTPADVSAVALVAHNPGITYLVNELARHVVTENVPTFGVAGFTVSGEWPDLRPAACTLDVFTAPKLLPQAF